MKYRCSCQIYEVEAWCDKYMQAQMWCAPNPVKKLVSIIITSTLKGKLHSLAVGDQSCLLPARLYFSNRGKEVL